MDRPHPGHPTRLPGVFPPAGMQTQMYSMALPMGMPGVPMSRASGITANPREARASCDDTHQLHSVQSTAFYRSAGPEVFGMPPGPGAFAMQPGSSSMPYLGLHPGAQAIPQGEMTPPRPFAFSLHF